MSGIPIQFGKFVVYTWYHLDSEPCQTYDIVGRTTISIYPYIDMTDLQYHDRHGRSPKNYDIVSRY